MGFTIGFAIGFPIGFTIGFTVGFTTGIAFTIQIHFLFSEPRHQIPSSWQPES